MKSFIEKILEMQGITGKPTQADKLDLYNRIKYSIETAYPIEKRDYSPAKPLPQTSKQVNTDGNVGLANSETGRTLYNLKVLTKTAWIYRMMMEMM
jgi:hypothetical protein